MPEKRTWKVSTLLAEVQKIYTLEIAVVLEGSEKQTILFQKM